jgi:signal transduction histidine kinase
MCNTGSINQVFLNILINSVQAIEEAGNLTLSVSADEARNTLTIKIKDDGVGIPESYIPHVFDVYFTTKPIGKGTGLGLPISRDIVLEHKGNIEIKSKAAIGTEVSITLPIRQNQDRI